MTNTSMEGSKRKGKEIVVEKAVEENIIDVEVDDDDDFVDDQWNNSGLRRSGRNKGNTESEGGKDGQGSSDTKDENEKKSVKADKGAGSKRKKVVKCDDIENVRKPKRKKGETSKVEYNKTYTFQTRSSPKKLFNAIQTLTPVQKMCLERIGLGGLLDFKLDGIPNKLAFYVVDKFNPETMEIKLVNDSIVITKDLIGELLGVRNDGKDIMEEDSEKDIDMLDSWNEQYDKKEILTGDVKAEIRKSKVADMNFKLNFIVLFANVMGGVKGKAVCDLRVLDHIRSDTNLASINWCEYVYRGLKSCKEGWKREMTNSYFLGPLTLLTMAYVDGIMCDSFYVPRIRPPTKIWTFELLKEREKEECEGVGLGMGAKQGPYIKEDADPMPSDEEGIVWKLSKLIEGIRNARSCFEKTLESGLVMFPGNLLMSDLNQQYRETLMVQNSGKDSGRDTNEEGIDGLKEKAGEGSGRGNNEERINDSNEEPFGSPGFRMGPQTQLEVFRSSDKACEDFYAEKNRMEMDKPSFSLGLTQDPLWATQKEGEGSGSRKGHEHEVGVQETEIGQYGSATNVSAGKEIGTEDKGKAVNVVPLSVVKPDFVREKRVCSKPGTMLSPFLARVIDIDGRYTTEEKLLESYLLTTSDIEFNDVLFESGTGVKVTFAQLMTLMGVDNIDSRVVDAWSLFLNSLEQYKDPASHSRFYLPNFDVDKKEFTSDIRAGYIVEAYLANVELMAARAGKQHMLKDVDIVFIPVSNGEHKFVVCFNIKKPAVMVFDNKKLQNPTDKECIIVATILQKKFGNFMKNRNHEKAGEILKSEITRGEFQWQTDKRPKDCGVFVMRHMEDYMGMNIQRWDCGIEDEGRKQTNQLGKLRKKYAARLLLSDCNINKDKIAAEMMKFRDANAKKKKVTKKGV